MTNTPISEAARELLDAKAELDRVEDAEPDGVSLLHPSRVWLRWSDREYTPADARYQAALTDFLRETGARYTTTGQILEAAEVIIAAVSA